MTFQVLGDDRVLWTSAPVTGPKQPAQQCRVSVLEVQQLKLRVVAHGSNAHCHAVWVNPALMLCENWSCGGWTNDKASFECALCGVRRGDVPPLSDINTDASSLHGFAASVLHLTAQVADEYTLQLSRVPAVEQDGVSPLDLESPYGVEVSAATLHQLAKLLTAVLGKRLPPHTMAPLLRIVRANLRRLMASRIDPHAAGLNADDHGNDDVAAAAGDSSAIPRAVQALCSAVAAVAASGATSSDARLLATETEAMALPLLLPTADARAAQFNARVPGGGVLEFQFNFPVTATAPSGEPLPVETVLLLLQMHCQSKGWACRVMGRWPAKVYLIMDVPAEHGDDRIANMLSTGTVAQLFEKVGIIGWTFPDGLPDVPITIEPDVAWPRASRLEMESNAGCVRVYPSSVAQFDAVVHSVSSFLPAAAKGPHALAASGTRVGAGAVAGAGAGAGAAAGAGSRIS